MGRVSTLLLWSLLYVAAGLVSAAEVEQVHVLPGWDSNLHIVFASRQRGVPSTVFYGNPLDPRGEDARLVANGTVLMYDIYSCPMPGAELETEVLVDLVNTSTYMPASSTAYFNPASTAEALKYISEIGGCLGHQNSAAYLQQPYIHRISLTHLHPDTEYWYWPEGSERTFGLTTPPAPGPDLKSSFRIAVWSNIGTTGVSQRVQAALKSVGPRLVLIPGGLSMANGWSPQWDIFGKRTEDLFSTVPVLVTPGPHEIAHGREQGIHLETRYPMPISEGGSSYFYSYEAGPVHFLNIVGSYAATDDKSAQYKFIMDDLSKVNRTRCPWVVAQFATPWYSSNLAHSQEGLTAQHDLEELLYKHGVDIVINGLVNSYERSLPVYKNELNECGMVHFQVGAGGSREGLAVGRQGGWRSPQPKWSAFRQASWGFGLLTVRNGTHADWEWRRVGCGTKEAGEGVGSDFYIDSEENCSTSGDASLDRSKAFDRVTLVRKSSDCFDIQESSRRLPEVTFDASKLQLADARPPRRNIKDLASIPHATSRPSKTSSYVRPRRSQPLTVNEVRARLDTLPSFSRRLQEDSGVQQVHLGVAGPGILLVTYVSKDADVRSGVHYFEANSTAAMDYPYVVRGSRSTYSLLTCLLTAGGLFGPEMGPPEVVLTVSDIVPLVNSSTTLPNTSAAYYDIKAASEVPALLDKNFGCLPWNLPHAYTNSPYIHTIVLSQLEPGVRYRYKPLQSGKVFEFKALPAPGEWSASAAPFRLGVWADVGVTNVSFSVMKAMLSFDPDLVLLVGDLSYADGWGPLWDQFGEMTEPLMATVPSLTVAGNHEIDSGREQKKPWLHRYPGPYQAYFSESSSYFSYETGLLHIIGLTAPYSPSGPGSAQRLWLEQDLYRVDRHKTPWIVVFFHVPWYSSNNAKFQAGYAAQQDLEPLLLMYGVDLVFNGHVHSYERSYPVANGSQHECGITHIVVGDGGNLEGPAVQDGWKEPQPEWSAFREASFGAGYLTVLNATHAVWEWQRVACVHTDGRPANQSLTNKPYFTWDGVSGPASGPTCQTSGDQSDDSTETSDRVVISRRLECRARSLKFAAPPASPLSEDALWREVMVGPGGNRGIESPEAANVSMPHVSPQVPGALECIDFVTYPGYVGDLNVSGVIAITAGINFSQKIFWALSGTDPHCQTSNPERSECTISVHSGSSCNSHDEVGEVLYDQDVLQHHNPWGDVRLQADAEGHSADYVGVPVWTGLALPELEGQAIVVYDSISPGQRAACCVSKPAIASHVGQLLAGTGTVNGTVHSRHRQQVHRPWWVITIWSLAILLSCILLCWGCSTGRGESHDDDGIGANVLGSGLQPDGEDLETLQPLKRGAFGDNEGIELTSSKALSSKNSSARGCFPKVCT